MQLITLALVALATLEAASDPYTWCALSVGPTIPVVRRTAIGTMHSCGASGNSSIRLPTHAQAVSAQWY
jgi:hypothetical protein